MGPQWTKALRGTLIFAVPLALVALISVVALGKADQRIVTTFFVTLSLALAIHAFMGPTGIMTFGHVAFMGVGAYVGAILTISPSIKQMIMPGLPSFLLDMQLPLLAVLPIAAVVGAVVAGLVGIVFARMEETGAAMATVSLLLIGSSIFSSADSWTGGSKGVYGIPEETTTWLAVGIAVLMIFIGQAFIRSKVGIQLRSTRSSALAAESLGVRVVRLRWIAWTLAGSLIGMAGALWAGHAIAFAPREFDFDLTFNLIAMLVVGGMYSVSGTVVGAALLTIVFEVMRRVEDVVGITGLTQVVVAAAILVVLYRWPNGIFGYREMPEMLAGLKARFAKRGGGEGGDGALSGEGSGS